MERPLDGFKAKLARADEHLGTLDDEIALFLETQPYAVRFEIDEHTAQKVARIYVNGEPPSIKWGLMIGDCVHNMRSALDHLAWELSGPKPPPKTEFPIFHDGKKFQSRESGGGLYKIRGIKDTKARALIESVQPCYSQPNRPKGHPLYSLHALSNPNKHQVLHLGVPSSVERPIGWKVGDRVHRQPAFSGSFKDGAEIGRFTPRPGESERGVDVNVHFSFDISFDLSGPGSGWPVIGGLRRIREVIRVDIERQAGKL